MDNYTLMWTHSAGFMMNHTEYAESKEHAFEKALCNSLVNFYLFEYLLDLKGKDKQMQQFLWLKNGKIC